VKAGMSPTAAPGPLRWRSPFAGLRGRVWETTATERPPPSPMRRVASTSTVSDCSAPTGVHVVPAAPPMGPYGSGMRRLVRVVRKLRGHSSRVLYCVGSDTERPTVASGRRRRESECIERGHGV